MLSFTHGILSLSASAEAGLFMPFTLAEAGLFSVASFFWPLVFFFLTPWLLLIAVSALVLLQKGGQPWHPFSS